MEKEKRMIDANTLHEELVYNTTRTGIGGCDCITVWRVADAIANAPTVDAVEVVHARWAVRLDENDCQYLECSVCGRKFYDSYDCTINHKFNYCPNCGAKMDGGNEDGTAQV